MMPHPISQKPMVVTANTMKFLDKMLTVFFARHMPDSTVAKPRFMKNTSMPVTMTHIVSAMILTSPAVSATAGAAAGSSSLAASVAGASAAGAVSAATGGGDS